MCAKPPTEVGVNRSLQGRDGGRRSRGGRAFRMHLDDARQPLGDNRGHLASTSNRSVNLTKEPLRGGTRVPPRVKAAGQNFGLVFCNDEGAEFGLGDELIQPACGVRSRAG